MAWMPALSKRTKISYSIIYVIAGILLYLALGRLLPLPDPISKNTLTLHLTELTVIVSLMGTGLKIDQPFTIKTWSNPFRLVSITMLLSILVVTLIARYFFEFNWASSILLGAVLAPTDPVLAADVQVGPPQEKVKDNVRFSLTAEAGMNDGTAFPFTWLAIAFAGVSNYQDLLAGWLLNDIVYRTIAGIIMGVLVGKAMAYLLFRRTEKNQLFTDDGFVAISTTLLVYGITEMVHGYGFIAVFICAITIRNSEMHHKFHRKLHSFTDQVERILVAIVLILFGGSLVTGILDALTWKMALFALAFVLLIRPATSLAGLVGADLHFKEKWAISFFGIKGMGTFFYLAFALHEKRFAEREELWAIGAFVVLLSIIIHGFTAATVMEKVEDEFAEPSDLRV
jgi:NhaP-type Na+/H+ or K+/H+ antiporter